MANLIDKDALIAKINKRIMDAPISYIGHQRVWAYNDVKDILDTLEVKEVDLDAEITKWEESFKHCPASMGYKETAKHFFELGLKAQKGE